MSNYIEAIDGIFGNSTQRKVIAHMLDNHTKIYTNKDLAEEFGVAPKTMESYTRTLNRYQAIYVVTRSNAVKFYKISPEFRDHLPELLIERGVR